MTASHAGLPTIGYARQTTFTPRERTIVELLPTHLNYGQIGDELYVSVNTVKSNVKSIYRKLGVTSRYEAVAIARQLGLINGHASSNVIESEPLDSTS
jgi:LuxR family transcriptional regulator, maltose regulon positive regulatory protein